MNSDGILWLIILSMWAIAFLFFLALFGRKK